MKWFYGLAYSAEGIALLIMAALVHRNFGYAQADYVVIGATCGAELLLCLPSAFCLPRRGADPNRSSQDYSYFLPLFAVVPALLLLSDSFLRLLSPQSVDIHQLNLFLGGMATMIGCHLVAGHQDKDGKTVPSFGVDATTFAIGLVLALPMLAAWGVALLSATHYWPKAVPGSPFYPVSFCLTWTLVSLAAVLVGFKGRIQPSRRLRCKS